MAKGCTRCKQHVAYDYWIGIGSHGWNVWICEHCAGEWHRLLQFLISDDAEWLRRHDRPLAKPKGGE